MCEVPAADVLDVDKAMRFIEDYAFKDEKEVYTNGAVLVPLFRVKQALVYKAYNGFFGGRKMEHDCVTNKKSEEFEQKSKIKTPYAQMIVYRRKDKPVYSIQYFDTTDGKMHEGFASYSLEHVFDRLNTEFEIEKETLIELRPVVRGEWRKSELFNDYPECPVCSYVSRERSNYCPNCGAVMNGGSNG